MDTIFLRDLEINATIGIFEWEKRIKQKVRIDLEMATDIAKALLDRNYHAPTTYFPMLVPECLLIEPTETETKEELDGFIEAMIKIKAEGETNPELLKEAPYTQPVRRLDEVRAAKQLDLAWSGGDR